MDRVTIDHLLELSPMQGVHMEIFEDPLQPIVDKIAKDAAKQTDEVIRKSMIAVHVDPDAMKRTAELNAELQAALRDETNVVLAANDLINRQKAEIERLHSEVKEKTETIDFLKDQVVKWGKDYCELKSLYVDFKAEHIETIKAIKNYKAEAIKEFEEKLWCKVFSDCEFNTEAYARLTKHIDNTKKEMVGDV